MLLTEIVDAAMREFKQNLTDICADVDLSELTPGLAERMCAALKTSLASAGAEGLCTFLQSYEERADMVYANGQLFRFNSVRTKKFMTPFGQIEVPRRCFQNKSDAKSHVPLDAAWGMENHFMAPQVREAVLFSCAHVTPEETARLLEKCALFTPSATAIKHVVTKTGQLLEEHREKLNGAVHAKKTAPEETRVLVASLDGATVLLNEKGQRFGRPAVRPRGDEPKQTPTAYRIAMVGSVSYYGPVPESETRAKRLESRYVSHMPQTRCPAFKAQFEKELDAAEAHAPPGTPRVLLLDGARELWNYLDKHPRYDGYHRCIDFFHAAEHLSVAAEALFANDCDKAKKWYEKYYTMLKESDAAAARICRSIDYYEMRQGRNATQQKHLREQHTYFRRNGKRMTYATFRNNGWPIGSGPIEAACKTLVKTRLCRSGMRWSRKGGQHILDLRTYIKSNRWERVWTQIKQLDRAA